MENNGEMKKNSTQQNLKHLGFVRVIAINTIVWLSNVYDNAKKNSGPLRSTVGSVENAATSVITPIYSKFKDVPDYLLVFLDQKVDMASSKFDENAPPLIKQAITQLHGLVHKTAQVTKEVLHQAQTGGPLDAARYAANESKDVLLNQTVKVLSKLDQLLSFHVVSEMIAPTANHFSERYNNVISDLRGKGYTVFSYLPLVPIDEIAKFLKQCKADNKEETTTAQAVASSQ